MSLQVIGNMEPGAKVVLWTETRQPVQTWTAHTRGLISSLVFPGMVLDVKGAAGNMFISHMCNFCPSVWGCECLLVLNFVAVAVNLHSPQQKVRRRR